MFSIATSATSTAVTLAITILLIGYEVLLDREERKNQMYLAESRLDTSTLVCTQSRHTVAACDEYLLFGQLGHRFSHEFDEA